MMQPDKYEMYYYVLCENCLVEGPPRPTLYSQAIEAWNKRVPLDAKLSREKEKE